MNSSRISILNKFIAVLAIACLVFAGGCSDDLRVSSPAADIQNSVSLGFSIEDPAMTRAVASLPYENEIRDVYLIFFDDAPAAGDALMAGYVKAAVADDDAGTLRFPIPQFLQKNNDYRILGLANPDGFTPSGFDNYMQYIESILPSSSESAPTMKDIEATLLLASDSSLVYNPEDEDFLIPMTGTASGEDSSLFRVLSVDGSYRMNRPLVFRRSVARIDVINGAESEFQLEQCAVCNFRDTSLPFCPTEATGEINDIGSMGNPVASLYTFPNSSITVESGDGSSTGVIIKGYYIEGGTPDSEASYYRVNIGSSGSSQMILPNHLYRLRIKSVNGRGAATPEEAYGSKESLIELAADSEWDEPGKWYDMDEDGNYIAVSQLRIDFPGTDHTANQTMVFASDNVDWHIEMDPGAEWLSVSKEDNCFYLTPSSDNTTGAARTAIVRVVGAVAGSTSPLCVTMTASQSPAGGAVEDWELPPLALVPIDAKYDATSGKLIADHVKVSHIHNPDDTWTNTIEIDGFDPTCFNSFIDIPCRLHIDPELGDVATITNTMEWPMVGCMSQDKAEGIKYTWNSFTTGATTSQQPSIIPNSLPEETIVNISVGAMAPDDPVIVRNITLESVGYKVLYELRIQPRPVIIDDVILRMPDESYIMVCDRNVQDALEKNLYTFTKWTSDGYRDSQAYHYGGYSKMSIPEKKDSNRVPVYETLHRAFGGNAFTSSAATNDMYNKYIKNEWPQYYKCDNCKLSPFYTDTKINDWGLPSKEILIQLCQNLHASKMRLFLLSDIKTKSNIEICSYLPFVSASETSPPTRTSVNYYMISNETGTCKGVATYFNNDNICTIDTLYNSGSSFKNKWLARYVRTVTDDLEMYKNDYLGYGTESSPLRPCTPDTYDWKSPYE